MNELKPEDVMRALECCERRDCERCHYKQRCGDACVLYLCGDALALLREKDAEIERLKHILESYALQYGTARDKEYFLQKARAEAITEFAERIKGFYRNLGGKTVGGSVAYHVDMIAKEMKGEQQ